MRLLNWSSSFVVHFTPSRLIKLIYGEEFQFDAPSFKENPNTSEQNNIAEFKNNLPWF